MRRSTVYTTRPDTLMGVTFVSVAAEHPLATLAAQSNPAAGGLRGRAASRGGVAEAELETMEKRGIDTGLRAIHPLIGDGSAGVGRQLRADGLRHRRGDGGAGA